MPLGDVLVLDANILIRAVLGRKVRRLIESYSEQGVRFVTPEAAFADAKKYLPGLLVKCGRLQLEAEASIEWLGSFVEIVPHELYFTFENQARERLRSRDEDDWPVLATALAFGAAIWSEDADFFGTGIAVWTSNRVEIFLRTELSPREP